MKEGHEDSAPARLRIEGAAHNAPGSMAVSEPRGGAASTALCCCSLVFIILMAIALIFVYSRFITHTKFFTPPKVRKYAYVNANPQSGNSRRCWWSGDTSKIN